MPYATWRRSRRSPATEPVTSHFCRPDPGVPDRCQFRIRYGSSAGERGKRLSLRCEVKEALCFGGGEEGALGEDRLAEDTGGADREGCEDDAGGGVEQVGPGGVAGGAPVGASGEHSGAVK